MKSTFLLYDPINNVIKVFLEIDMERRETEERAFIFKINYTTQRHKAARSRTRNQETKRQNNLYIFVPNFSLRCAVIMQRW